MDINRIVNYRHLKMPINYKEHLSLGSA